MRIDPRRWGRQKIVFDVMGSQAGGGKGTQNRAAAGAAGAVAGATSMHAIGTWECEEPEEAGPNDQDQVTWVFKTRDGQVRRRETVRLTQRTAHTDRFTTLLERLHQSSESVAVPAGPRTGAAPPTADDESAPTEPFAAAGAGRGSAPAAATTRARSLSPPPYVPIAPRTLIYNEEDEFQLVSTALNDEERAAAHARERAEYRKLALSALAEIQDLDEVELGSVEAVETAVGVGAVGSGEKPLPKVEGFARDDDDDDDDEVFEALRLRGGAGGEASDSDSDSDSGNSSSASSGSDSDVEAPQPEGDVVAAAAAVGATAANPATAVKETLTALFKPGSAAAATAAASSSAAAEAGGGFSLFSGMDLDLDEGDAGPDEEADGVTIPLAPPIDTLPVQSRPLPSSGGPMRGSRYGQHSQVSAGPLGLGAPSKPFFLFPSGPFEDPERPGQVNEAEVAELVGLPAVGIERAREESKRRVEEATKDFWRHESQCVRVWFSCPAEPFRMAS